VPRAGSAGVWGLQVYAQLGGLRKRFLDPWLVCVRTSVVLTNQKSLFPQRKSRARLPIGPTADLCVDMTIGAGQHFLVFVLPHTFYGAVRNDARPRTESGLRRPSARRPDRRPTGCLSRLWKRAVKF
jgi:hypothetical protein